MAEELDIRSVWNRSKAKEDPSSLRIDKLERKGTKTILYWIKMILWIEFGLTIISMPFLLVYVTARGDSTAWITFYIIVTFIYLCYYQFLIYQIRKFSYDGNVLQSLKKVYGYLWFYHLHYKVVFWLSMICGIAFAFQDPASAEELAKIETTKQWALVIAVWAVMLLVIGAVFHTLLHLIYGRKITRLRQMVKDLESGE